MNTLLVPMPDVGDTIVVQFFGLKKMGRVLHKNNDIYTIQYKHATLTDTLHFPWYYPKSSPKHVKLPAHLKNTADIVTSGRKRTPTDFYKAEPARRQKRCADDIALAVTAESDDDETGLPAHAAIHLVDDMSTCEESNPVDKPNDTGMCDTDDQTDDALRRIRAAATRIIAGFL